MNKKSTSTWLQFIFILGLLFTLSGCWDLEDVDRRVFATTVGIDLNAGTGNKIDLSVQIPLSEKMLPVGARSGGQGKRFNTISTAAETVQNAFADLQEKTNGDLVIQQNKSIVIGESAARRDVTPILDWLLRGPAAPPQSLVFIAGDTTAKEILTFVPAQETLPGMALVGAAQTITKSDRTAFIPLWKFSQKLVQGSKDTYAPLISLDKEEGQYVIAGLALFNGKRMVGKLSPEETQSFVILANSVKAGIITLDLPGQRKLSLRNLRARTKIKVKIDQGSPFFLVKTTINASLSELTGGYIKLTPQENRRLEKMATVEIRSRLEQVIKKLQQLNSDPINFGEEFRAQHQEIWQRTVWKKVFRAVPFRIEIQVKIQRDGIFR